MVKLRLKRMGSKFNAFYRIVASDVRAPRDGRFIEEVGYYNPHQKEIFVNKELRSKWEKVGAVASTTVKNLFKKYDQAEDQDSKDGVVTLKIKPKKLKKQETKVDEKVEDNTEENSKSKASDSEETKAEETKVEQLTKEATIEKEDVVIEEKTNGEADSKEETKAEEK